MELGDWALTVLAGIVIGCVAGISTFFGLFRNSRKEIFDMLKEYDTKLDYTEKGFEASIKDARADWDRRHDKVEEDIKLGVAAIGLHAVQLGEIRINQININASLNEIKSLIRNGNH